MHRGLATILLDSAVALAVQSTLDQGLESTTLELKVSLLRPVIPDTVLICAEGLVLKAGRGGGNVNRQPKPATRPRHDNLFGLRIPAKRVEAVQS